MRKEAGMEAEGLVSSLKRYYSFLDKLCSLWEGVPKKVSKPLSTMETLAEQLIAVSSADDDLRINIQFPCLKQSVTFKTLMSLEQELSIIINFVKELDVATEKLNRLVSSVNQHRELSDISSESESVRKLLEYALDCRQYYQAQSSAVQVALTCLDFRDLNSIKDLRESFNEDKNLKSYIQRCLLFGKHFASESEETVTLILDDTIR